MKKSNMLKTNTNLRLSVFASSIKHVFNTCKNRIIKNPWLWLSFLLYVVAYVPYAILSKQVGMKAQIWQIMILTSAAACVVTVTEFFLIGMYRFFRSKQLSDIVSFWKELKFTPANVGMACASATISMTTNASYMYTGAALVTMLLLTRGSVLLMAPVSDKMQHRPVKTNTWIGFCLALLAVLCSITGAGMPTGTGWLIILGMYALAYFVNMKHYGSNQENFRFLCASQLVCCFLMLTISICSLLVTNVTDFSVLSSDTQLKAFFVGILAQTTGIFGPMIMMSKTEQTYSVPINRSGSVFAGALAQKILGKNLELPAFCGIFFFIAAVIMLASTKTTQSTENESVQYVTVRDESAALQSQE